ncbi:MAG: lipoyl(octanoyl) transferase LipB [Hyphomicrobiaceae bacterium]
MTDVASPSTTPPASRIRPADAVGWAVSSGPVDYPEAVAAMEARVAAMAEGSASELIWLTSHPSLYTAGTSARSEDLIHPDRFPVYRTGRGGQYTYHGPGQRVVYVMLDVRRRAGDVKAFVAALEAWTVTSLARLGIVGETRCGRVGVWVGRPGATDGREDKIAAIGIRLRRWVSFHGLAINVSPDLAHFDGIVPCGIREHGVTSLARLLGGDEAQLALALDDALRAAFEERFGVTRNAVAPL